MPAESRPGSQLLRIALCRVVPDGAAEAQVHQALSELGGVCWQSYSEYNLIGLIPCSLAQAQPNVTLQSAPFLRQYQEVLCFSWDEREAPGRRWRPVNAPLSKWKAPGPARAVSLLKMNESLVRSAGIEAEQAFCRWLRTAARARRAERVWALAYGTLGWPEVAVLWAAPSFDAIIACMMALRRLHAADLEPFLARPFEPPLKQAPLFAYTHTLPAVALPTWTPGRSVDDNYRGAVLGAMGSVRATVQVMCASGADDSVLAKVQGEFGATFRCQPNCGCDDLVIEPAEGKTDLLTLAKLVHFLRLHLGARYIRSTQVRISRLSEPPPPPLSAEPAALALPEKHPWATWAELLKDLALFEEHVANPLLRLAPSLSQTLSRYRAVATVAELDGLLDDLSGLVCSIFARVEMVLQDPLLSTVDQDLRAIYDWLGDAIKVFQAAFDQRMCGAQIGQGNTAPNFTTTQAAGVQRILTAANAVPCSLLAEMAFRKPASPGWDRFTVFGYEDETLRLDCGAMNIPSTNLLDPAEWWMLSHEAGHEFAYRSRLLERPDIRTAIERAYGALRRRRLLRGSRLATREEMEHLVEEVYATVFSFELAFRGNWVEYSRTLWSFLQAHLQGRADESDVLSHLVRYTFVYFYHLETEGGLEPNERIASAIEEGHELNGQIFLSQRDESAYRASDATDRNLRFRAFAPYESLADLIRQWLMEPLAQYAPRAASLICQVNAARVAHWYLPLERLRSHFVQQFREAAQHSPRAATRRAAREGAARLRKGGLCLEQTVSPIDVVMTLKREKTRLEQRGSSLLASPEWTRAVLAAILSLWHLEKTSAER